MEHEQWLPIQGYDYEISSLGRVRNSKGHVMRPKIKDGVEIVKLTRNRNSYDCAVHILVNTAFHGPRPDGHETRHIDGDRLNNREANLKWILRGSARHHRAVLLDSDVTAILERLLAGDKMKLLAEQFNVGVNTIQRIKSGESWKHIPRPEGFEEPIKGIRKGSNHSASKLTESDVIAILRRAKDGVTQTRLARDYGVCQPLIGSIIHGKSWLHVPRP